MNFIARDGVHLDLLETAAGACPSGSEVAVFRPHETVAPLLAHPFELPHLQSSAILSAP